MGEKLCVKTFCSPSSVCCITVCVEFCCLYVCCVWRDIWFSVPVVLHIIWFKRKVSFFLSLRVMMYVMYMKLCFFNQKPANANTHREWQPLDSTSHEFFVGNVTYGEIETESRWHFIAWSFFSRMLHLILCTCTYIISIILFALLYFAVYTLRHLYHPHSPHQCPRLCFWFVCLFVWMDVWWYEFMRLLHAPISTNRLDASYAKCRIVYGKTGGDFHSTKLVNKMQRRMLYMAADLQDQIKLEWRWKRARWTKVYEIEAMQRDGEEFFRCLHV